MDARLKPDGLSAELARFAAHELAKGASPRTVDGRESSLRAFIAWCQERSITEPVEVTLPVMERYRRFLYHYRMPNGRPLSISSQRNRLSHIKVLFRYLARQGHILYNPMAEFELPRPHKRLPRAVLTVDEVETICRQCLYHPLGVRDRAIIETFYATGIRRQELGNLDLYDVELDQGTLMVRLGKGNKDRLLPIGERACAWIEKYIHELRPSLMTGEDDLALFVDDFGKRFTPHKLSDKVKSYLELCDITKPGACHLFRHTMATLMLENGADIRFIQAMLGHADISTTTIYTQVSIRTLKEVYSRTHPAKHIPHSQALIDPPATVDEPTAEDVLDALDDEAREDRE